MGAKAVKTKQLVFPNEEGKKAKPKASDTVKAFKSGNAGDLLNKYTSQNHFEGDFKRTKQDFFGLQG